MEKADAATVRILVLGPTGVGKTPLVLRYMTGRWDGADLGPTVEELHRKTVTLDISGKQERYQLEIMDTSGASELQALSLNNVHWAAVVLLCFSPSSPDSHERVLELHRAVTQAKGPSPFVVLVSLRSDLPMVCEQWQRPSVIKFADDIGARAFFETSAKTGENVQAVFEWAAAHYILEQRTITTREKRLSGDGRRTGASLISRLSPFKSKKRESAECNAHDIHGVYFVFSRAAAALPIQPSASSPALIKEKSPSPSRKTEHNSKYANNVRERTRSADEASPAAIALPGAISPASAPPPSIFSERGTVRSPQPPNNDSGYYVSGHSPLSISEPDWALPASRSTAPCPVCGRQFAADAIDVHVNECLDKPPPKIPPNSPQHPSSASGSPALPRRLVLPGGDAFHLADFLVFAGVSGPDTEVFLSKAAHEGCEEEAVALDLSPDDLQQLGLSRLGDRKKYLVAARKWKDSRGTIDESDMMIPTSEISIVGEPLGIGNFAVVYLGRFNMAKVAVKILRQAASWETGVDKEFLKEARTLKRLTERGHPNVLRFFGICRMETPFKGWGLVTEYMSNGSLRSFLVAKGAGLKRRVLLNFGKSTAAGMLHLSSHNPPILHRDLSARNLLVGDMDAADGTYALRVADFGLARRGDDESGDYSVKNSPTPTRWTAPEVWRTRQHSAAADVWSFGVTLWEIMTLGERPYDPWKDDLVFQKVCEGHKLPRISPSGRDVGEDLHPLMLECWHMEPAQRIGWKDIYRRLQLLEEEEIRRSGTNIAQ